MRLLLLAGFLLATASQGLAQTEHEVRLFRPSKANDQYRLGVAGHQIRQVVLRNAAGEALRSERESFSVDMSGSVRVEEVDAKGNVTRSAITVDSLVRAIGLRRDELLRPGTIVIERRTGPRQEFLIGGRAVSPELKDVLELALSETNDPGAPSDDELMGTKQRQKVGGRWPVNRERLARFFAEDRELAFTVRPEDIEGGGELVALARSGGLECMRVDIAMTILGAPRGAMPPGTPKARVEIKLSSLLPLDTKLDQLEETTQLTMTLTAPAGPPREGRAPDQIVTVWEQRSDRKLKPIR